MTMFFIGGANIYHVIRTYVQVGWLLSSSFGQNPLFHESVGLITYFSNSPNMEKSGCKENGGAFEPERLIHLN